VIDQTTRIPEVRVRTLTDGELAVLVEEVSRKAVDRYLRAQLATAKKKSTPLSPKQIAHELRIRPQRVYEVLRAGEIPLCRPGARGGYRVRRSDAMRWADSKGIAHDEEYHDDEDNA